jgi:ABC-2 type transport system permease protein
MLNPLAVIFEQVRVWVLAEPPSAAPSAAQAAGGWVHLLPAVAIYVGICVSAAWIFNREAPRIAEDL